MKNIISMPVALAFLMSVSLGCFFATSSTTVKGYVEYDDKPVEGATVTFGPTLGEATTTTGPDGKFTITAKRSNVDAEADGEKTAYVEGVSDAKP